MAEMLSFSRDTKYDTIKVKIVNLGRGRFQYEANCYTDAEWGGWSEKFILDFGSERTLHSILELLTKLPEYAGFRGLRLLLET